MHPFAARILAARGLNTTDWRSTVVTRDLVCQADLILTATEAHKSVVRFDPSAMSRTFTILQLAHRARSINSIAAVRPEEYGPWLVQQVRDRHGMMQPLSPDSRDISDPMGKSFYQFQRCAITIERAFSQILRSGPPLQWSWPTTADSEGYRRFTEDPNRLTIGTPDASGSADS